MCILEGFMSPKAFAFDRFLPKKFTFVLGFRPQFLALGG